MAEAEAAAVTAPRLTRPLEDDGVMEGGPRESAVGVDLYWIPLGAGSKVPTVRWNGMLFERLVAWREGRAPCDLYHAGLEVRSAGARFVIEMAPAWGPASREAEVAATGPVGLRVLGRSRFFRYQVRCWRDGVIPDAHFAVGGPRRVTVDPVLAQRVVDLVPSVPTATWGRDDFGTGDMWNSNSLVAWLLARSGVALEGVAPPAGGRAPGWAAGLSVAARLP